MTAGYSGTPLSKKLSLKPGMRVWFDAAMPESVRCEIDPEALGVNELPDPVPGLDAAHMFVKREWELHSAIVVLRPLIALGLHLGVLAQKGIEGADRDYRGCDPRDRAANRAGRYQGLRGGRDMVRTETDDPAKRALTTSLYWCHNSAVLASGGFR